mgnify:CR=1 FL=1
MLYFATPVSEIEYEHKYPLVRLTLYYDFEDIIINKSNMSFHYLMYNEIFAA